MSPTISIVTPAYNAASTISECISSVQAQTFADWELIIVDDNSGDETLQIIQDFAKSDSRIIFIRHLSNEGVAATRNTALQAARSRYIAFLDSDDIWLPTKLENQLSFMISGNVAFSYTLYRRFKDKSDGKISKLVRLPSEFHYPDLLKRTGIACLTVMIDSDQTGPLRFSKIKHEDYALWLSILKRGITARGVMKDLARYRVSSISVSGNKFRSAKWVWNIYRTTEKLSTIKAAWCFLNYGINRFRRSI